MHLHICIFAVWIYSIIYYTILYEQVILIHPVNELLHMLKVSSSILSRVIWKMWVKINLQLYLIFIVILIGTYFYWESTVGAKCLYLNYHIKFCLQRLGIIRLCRHIILVWQRTSFLRFLHLYLPSKYNNVLWYVYFFNIGWKILLMCFLFPYSGLLIRPFFMSSFLHIICIH